MSTSGSFTPPAAPPCPYTPRMTRAAALALATAGSLSENCVVVITDGPTIGTTGNSSTTEIELNPVSATAFGQTARVLTTFGPEAWPGVYNLATNSITELRDDFGNTAKDIDSAGPTVHTQFPWHLGSATFRDNYVEDSTLPGWDTQVGNVTNNRVIGSSVDLTGKTSGVIQDNLFQNAGLILGSGGASVNMSRTQIYGVTPSTMYVNHTGTGGLTYSDTIQRDGFIVAHSGTGSFTAQDAVLQNHSTAAADVAHAGGAPLTIIDSTVTAPVTGTAFDVQPGTTGTTGVQRSVMNGPHVTKVTGSSGPLSIVDSDLTNPSITVGAANAALTNSFANVRSSSSSFNLLGPVAGGGRNDFFGGVVADGASFTVAATATAGLGIVGGEYNSLTGGVVQNRTAGTGSTSLYATRMRGFTTFTDNGTTDPGVGTSFNRLDLTDSAVTVGNVTGKTGSGTMVQQTSMTGSTLTLTGPNGGAFLNRVRLWGASLTNAGFDGSDLIIDGAFSHTMTATQSNRLMNKSFTDWI